MNIQDIIYAIKDMDFDILYAEPYNGLPIAMEVLFGLLQIGKNKSWSSYRLMEKDHGEGGKIFGAPISENSKVIVIGKARYIPQCLVIDMFPV